MPESETLLVHEGVVDHKIIDHLLKDLKKNKGYRALPKITGKRVYSISVECLENIMKHATGEKKGKPGPKPYFSVVISENKVIIKTGNQIDHTKVDQLERRLIFINDLDEGELSVMYEKKISKEILSDENSAGLGFILMRLKSGNTLEYSFTETGNGSNYFYMQISVNKYIMRKLVIEKTASSPKVYFDPEKDIYEIAGESRPPDVAAFYNEIINWFDEFTRALSRSEKGRETVVFNLDLEYFNSSSAKYLLDFCKQVASARIRGVNIAIKWHFEKDDTDMLEAGKEMSRLAKIPFEFVQRN